MRKILFFALAVALFSTACEDEINREKSPLPNPDSDNVYFDAANPKSLVLAIDATEFTVSVSREFSEAALDVKIKLESSYDKGLFNVPETLSFAAGETTKTLTVGISDLELMKKYKIALIVEDDQTNPYVPQTVYPRIDLNILQEDFAPYAEGTYTCDFFEDSWAQTLEYSPATTTYRFKGLWFPGYDVTFKWDGSATVTMIGTAASGKIVIPTGYVHATYGMVAAHYGVCTFDDATDTFTFPINWRVTAGSFGDYPGTYVITSLVK